ncbi:copper amine oxidase N-terminal domain-containing protein [Bacillus sp. Bva_UNVM-123]|uniref:stalk domain-containing protein n=1 Tax=Bacillus sp. Bva_UNVM-123 TaxID=2829798 RepID=UPI00391F5908
MKNIGLLSTALLLTSGIILTPLVSAKEKVVQNVESEQQLIEDVETTDYLKYTGSIKEITKDEKRWTVSIGDENGIIAVLLLDKESLLFHSGTGEQLKDTDLKIGSTLDAYYDKNKPMLLIYPPQLAPDFIIINDEEVKGNVKVSKFDENNLSLDGQLKLNISKDTILENQLGESIEEAKLSSKELIVFYSATTRSIPAQTSPVKIIAIDKIAAVKEKIRVIIKNDHIMKNGEKMIPLRQVAEVLGYQVQTESKTSEIYVTKQNLSFSLKSGEKVYGFNRSIGQFKVAPFLKNNELYVPEAFVEQLLENS